MSSSSEEQEVNVLVTPDTNSLEERVKLLEEAVSTLLRYKTSNMTPSDVSEDIVSAPEKESDGKRDNHNHTCIVSKKKQLSALGVLKKHVFDFWDNISLPCLKYLGQYEQPRPDRFLWFILLLASLVISSRYIEDAYKKWQDSPVLLTFNDSMTPIAHIPFPAVTFCPAIMLRNEDQLRNLIYNCQQANNCTQHEKLLLIATFHLCSSSKLFDLVKKSGPDGNNSLSDAFKQIMPVCTDTVRKLSFNKGLESSSLFDCQPYMQSTFAIARACFTFNMLPAKDLFNDQVEAPVIDNTVFPAKPGWSPDSMLQVAAMGPTVPRHTDNNKLLSGLSVSLKPYQNYYSDLCMATKSKFIIHHPGELPSVSADKYIDVPAGKKTVVRILPELITASEELNSTTYTPANRRCYFSHERSLSLFRSYTQGNCQLECYANCSFNLCGCVPFYLPRINSSVRICANWQQHFCSRNFVEAIKGDYEAHYAPDLVDTFVSEQFKQKYQYFLKTVKVSKEAGQMSGEQTGEQGRHGAQEIFQFASTVCECDCPATCTSLKYGLEITDVETFKPEFEHHAAVAVTFKDLEVASILRKELIGLSDFIANSGGLLGVFMGFSFLSLWELLYYLTLRLWSTIKSSWDEDIASDKDTKSEK